MTNVYKIEIVTTINIIIFLAWIMLLCCIWKIFTWLMLTMIFLMFSSSTRFVVLGFIFYDLMWTNKQGSFFLNMCISLFQCQLLKSLFLSPWTTLASFSKLNCPSCVELIIFSSLNVWNTLKWSHMCLDSCFWKDFYLQTKFL